jgi:MFS family permease
MKTEDKNFYLGVINGALFNGASVFISGNIVIPLLLENFTSSRAIIGFASALLSIGWYLPQFFAGYFSEKKVYKMPMYRFVAWLRISSFASIIFAILIFKNLWIILSLILIYSLSGGLSGIAFMEIVAKTIPPKRRGYFWGGRLFFGGLLALIGSFIVSFILGKKEIFLFPINFVILFLIAFILISLAFLLYMGVEEPPSEIVLRRNFKEYSKEAIDSLKSNITYRRLIVTKYLCGATSIAFPFYVLYGIEYLKFPTSVVGAFLLSSSLGGIISNILWGYISEKEGNKLVLQIYAIISIICPVIAILSSHFETWKHLYIFTFLLLGFAESGSWIGFANFLLEISPVKNRTSYVGFMHTITSFVLLIPTLGGYLVDKIQGNSYNTIFILAFLFGLFGLLNTFKLVEPRIQSS